MDLQDAEDLAHNLLDEHNLSYTWTFGFDNAVERSGLCSYRRNHISLSRHYVRAVDEREVRDTILHEIAHALCGKEHNHDDVWRLKHISIGGSGRRTSPDYADAPPRWEGTCPNCGNRYTRHRLAKGVKTRACTPCCDTLAGGKWDKKFQLQWKKVSA